MEGCHRCQCILRLISLRRCRCPGYIRSRRARHHYKTNAYANLGEANVFTILIGVTEQSEYYDIDMGFGPEEFEATYATIDSEGLWHGSSIEARVSEKGEIKIYGDASKIDVIKAIGCYITDIDLSKCENLDILVLEHNELKGLDLTPNTKLSAIYLSG